MARICRLLILMLFLAAPLAISADMPEGRLMRFADIYKDKIVFSYAGDLWLVASSGGVARRITTDPGLELFPKFSPDGKWIAFTGQYDGNFNVYVMPADGGEPKQLTFEPDATSVPERMGPNNQVITWLPDSQRILFLSRRDTFNDWFGRLFTVSIDGGLPERLPIDKGGLTSFSPDGTKIAYNRIFRNFRTWKRYTGGMAQDIAIYDFKNNTYERITDYPGTDTYPMWHGDTIYFGSDRGPEHRINLYSYSLKTKQTRQLTDFKDYDVDWPSLGPDSIVFSNGGYLYTFDLKSQKAKKLTVYLPGDRDLARPHWANVSPLRDRLRHFPGRQSRRPDRARRHLHRPRQGRQHPQSHPDAGHPREVCRLVARRQMDRLSFRPQRRRGDLHHPARRHGQGNTHHHRRQDVPHASRLVARQQEAALCRQRPAPVLCGY